MIPALSGFIADGFTHAPAEIRIQGRKRILTGRCGEVAENPKEVVIFAGSPGAPVHPACVRAIEDEQRRRMQ